jgi:hypothetical protein
MKSLKVLSLAALLSSGVSFADDQHAAAAYDAAKPEVVKTEHVAPTADTSAPAAAPAATAKPAGKKAHAKKASVQKKTSEQSQPATK